MGAFKNFKKIQQLKTIEEKHREWLKDYEGIFYSIATEGKHEIKWSSDKKYYYDKIWSSGINCIGAKKDRLCIEFDDKNENGKKDIEKITENINKVTEKLKEKKWGYIRSTHKGISDYLWVEFDRALTQKEKESFLIWIAPEKSEIDLNFTSYRKVFPILFAVHWKHSANRELPIEFYEGKKIDFDSLNISKQQKLKKRIIKNKSFEYITGIKEASKIFTLEGQTERFNEIQPFFYDKSGMFWLWNKNIHCWEISDEVDLLNMIHKSTGKDVISSKNRTEILNSLKQKGRLNLPNPIRPTWIQFYDMIVDIKTGEEFKATPKYFVTNPIPYKLHEERFVETPTMDRLFEEWVGKDYVQTLYEIIAYCLLPNYPIHRLFCLVGAGMNGKSCFLRLLERFLGSQNACSTELDTLLRSQFEVTRLHKKLICLMGETNFGEISKTSMLKKLTGGDLIGFEYKNKNPFQDKNYAKIIISTNNLPSTTDKTIGFYRRWCIIDFPNCFSEKKDILNDIPEEEYEILTVKSLKILFELLEKKEFHNEGTIDERKQKYESKSNFLEEFLKSFTIEKIDGFITKADFYKKFSAWSKENRHREMSETSLGLIMKKLGIESGKKYFNWLYDGKGGDARIWLDLEWKE